MSTSTSGVSISGLVSGIDTDSVIEKLMKISSQPLTLLQNKSDDYSAKSTVINNLKTKLQTLQDTVEDIKDVSDPLFSQKSLTSTDTSVVSGILSGTNSATGSYSLNITQLASAAIVSGKKLYTSADASALPATASSTAAMNAAGQTLSVNTALSAQSASFATAPAASGTIVVNGKSIAWDDSMTINDIVGAINSASTGATATFDASSQTITLESQSTGDSAEITLSQSSGNLLEVLNLAAGTVEGSDAVLTDASKALSSADAHLDQAVTSGTFTINGVVFSVDANEDSLTEVLTRINSSNAGVTAMYDSGTGQVSLYQKATGADKKIVLGSSTDTSNVLYALKLSDTNPPTGAAADTYSGTDAQLSLNGGATQTFSANKITTLLPGITVNLTSVGNATLNSNADVDGMVDKIQEFVTNYNAVMDYINTKLSEEAFEDPETATERIQGAFVADFTFTETKDSLTSMVSSVVKGLSSEMNQLAQIGITTTSDNFGQDATLELDEDALRAALSSNPDAVGKIFNDSSNGIMVKIDAKLKSLTNSTYGALSTETEGYDEEITSLAEQMEKMQDRLDQEETRLRTAYSQMESLLSTLQTQSAYLEKMEL